MSEEELTQAGKAEILLANQGKAIIEKFKLTTFTVGITDEERTGAEVLAIDCQGLDRHATYLALEHCNNEVTSYDPLHVRSGIVETIVEGKLGWDAYLHLAIPFTGGSGRGPEHRG